MPARPPPIDILRCPATGDKLVEDGDGALVTSNGEQRYAVVRDGVPVLMREGAGPKHPPP
ncbi:MAG: hypothetical protein QOK04_1426 [Solirubrobacteraceae bacterium]|nr:hypothetical protein [Solirubrobacteraceae bacterium]